MSDELAATLREIVCVDITRARVVGDNCGLHGPLADVRVDLRG